MTRHSPKDSILDGIAEMEADILASGKPAVMFDETLPFMPIDTDQLSWAGELLFGRNWKTELAEIFGLKDSAHLREILRDERPVPKNVGGKVLATIRSRIVELSELADEIELGGRRG